MARSKWEWPRPELGPGNRVRMAVYELAPPLERLFCEGDEHVRLYSVLFDNRRGGMMPKIRTRTVPTARPGVVCVEFAEPLHELVAHLADDAWLRALLRKNRAPGRRRLSGGDEWEAI